MISKVGILEAWNAAGNADPTSAATAAFLADDFQNVDQNGKVLMNKQEYLGMGRLLAGSFKDIKYVFDSFQEDGDHVIARFHAEGTHTSDLDLTGMGMGVIPASGKRIVWPETSALFRFRGDKIVQIQPLGDGVFDWFLAPLGVKLPTS